jgi:hypothetical protein
LSDLFFGKSKIDNDVSLDISKTFTPKHQQETDDVFDKYGDNHKTQKKNEKKLRQFDGISEISEESPL